MKLLYLLFSDIHVPDDPKNEVFEQSMAWVVEQIRARQPKAVIHLGDTFRSMTSVSIPALEASVRWMRMIASVGPEVIVLAGNHDQWNVDRTITSLVVFKAIDRVRVVTEAEVGEVAGELVLLLPYEHMDSEARSFLKTQTRFVFCHLPINDLFGIQEPLGYAAEDLMAGIQRKVFCGHYHWPMSRWFERGGTETHFVSIGSLMATSWSDEQSPEDTERSPRGIVLVYEDGSHETIPNPHSPIYRTIRVEEGDEVLNLPEQDEDRTILRVYCPPEAVDSVRKRVDSLAYQRAEVMPTKRKVEVVRRAEVEQMSMRQAVEDYAERHCPEDLDKARLRQVGLYFLQEGK